MGVVCDERLTRLHKCEIEWARKENGDRGRLGWKWIGRHGEDVCVVYVYVYVISRRRLRRKSKRRGGGESKKSPIRNKSKNKRIRDEREEENMCM